MPELNPDIEVVKVNVQVDYVHMVIVMPPKYAVACVVQYIKSQSAKALKAKFPWLNLPREARIDRTEIQHF